MREDRAVQKRNVAGVDAALQTLRPVVLLDVPTDDALLGWDQRSLWARQRRTFISGPHVDPDDATGLFGRIRGGSDFLPEVRLRWLVGHVNARAVDVELPAVIDAAEPVFLVSSEEQ